MTFGGKNKFQRKKEDLSKEEKDARDKRFQEAIARYEALPETIALREAVKRSGDVDLRIRMNV